MFASTDPQAQAELEIFVHTLKDHAMRRYRVDPYVIAVAIPSMDTPYIKNIGMDAVSSYAYLPDVSESAPPVQSYTQRAKVVMAEWDTIPHTFVPSAVVGWDSSPRGENGYSLEDVAGIYPYTPIIVNDSTNTFSDMLRKSMQWTLKNVPLEEQYGIICAWNEIAQANALLPEIRNGKVDLSYINAVSKILS
jgi:hypothetical protein